MRVHGRCHCGEITYEVEVDPAAVNIYHCRDCQTLSSSAFRVNIHASAETLRISGGPRRYIKTGSSGARRLDAFCGTCGTPVYSTQTTDPQSYTVRVGAQQQAALLGLVWQQIWTRRRLPWLLEIYSAETFDGQP